MHPPLFHNVLHICAVLLRSHPTRAGPRQNKSWRIQTKGLMCLSLVNFKQIVKTSVRGVCLNTEKITKTFRVMSCHKTDGKANTFQTVTATTAAPNNNNNIVIRDTNINNYSFFYQPVGAFINGHQGEGQILLPRYLSPLIHYHQFQPSKSSLVTNFCCLFYNNRHYMTESVL